MITVFGSINLDLVVSLPRLPSAGETVTGPDHQSFAGGKGANQALAARRAGSDVSMFGAVGDDGFAGLALANLDGSGVDLAGVRHLDGATGLAMIGVDSDGENLIMVASGANARVEAEWLQGQLGCGSLLMLQGEAPFAQILRAMDIARAAGAKVFFNPAPVPGGDLSEAVQRTDILVVNEAEAVHIGKALGIADDSEELAAAWQHPDILLVVTLGPGGVLARLGDDIHRISAPRIEAVDTTGAGDAFCGALASAIDAKTPLPRALRQAVAAGTLACLATGAQSSAPSHRQIAEMADRLV